MANDLPMVGGAEPETFRQVSIFGSSHEQGKGSSSSASRQKAGHCQDVKYNWVDGLTPGKKPSLIILSCRNVTYSDRSIYTKHKVHMHFYPILILNYRREGEFGSMKLRLKM